MPAASASRARPRRAATKKKKKKGQRVVRRRGGRRARVVVRRGGGGGGGAHLTPLQVYYLSQARGSGLPYFAGHRFQYGSGLGSVFRSLLRRATPIVSALGKRALGVGKTLVRDFFTPGGQRDWSGTVKRRLMDEGEDIMRDVIRRKVPHKYVRLARRVLPSAEDEEEEDIFSTPPS